MLSGAQAAPQRKPAIAKPDLARDFSALAQQRPRKCIGPDAAGGQPPGWKAEPAECAWQNLLQVRRWSAMGAMQPGSCVSPQAQWWAWARRGSDQPAAWRAAWTVQGLVDERGPEKRIALIERASNGQWSATEWRWNPSLRAATRRWQEGRWKLLVAHVAARRQASATAGLARETRMLQSVWENNLGARAGEITGDSWRWQGGGVCLRTDPVGLGQQQLHLSYSVEDSRLEQRAAMQLQLARRFPEAVWITPFRLVPAAPQARGGAKFEAVWIENNEVKGQLWIPTKGEGPVVRLRINASLPAAPNGQPSPAAVGNAAQAVERELIALANRWTAEHD